MIVLAMGYRNQRGRRAGSARGARISKGRGPAAGGREWRWIERIRRRALVSSRRLIVGIGDDAAVWSPPPRRGVVLTVDVQVEGVHFRRDWMSLREIGLRSVSVSVSDIAALGARPTLLLVSIVAGGNSKRTPFSDRDFNELYGGIAAGARQYGIPIAGGNLSEGPLSITIVALGEGEPARLVLRSGAHPGDEIWVTGTPGLARIGLQFLSSGQRAGRSAAVPQAIRRPVRAFVSPRARVPEALWLARRGPPTSMVDLSDGLSTDLEHILRESAKRSGGPLGAEIDEDSLLGLPGLRKAALAAKCSPVESALSGGDDYELAFTLRPGHGLAGSSDRSRGKILGTPITRIGRIVERSGLWLRLSPPKRGLRLSPPKRGLRRLRPTGWAHFAR